MVLFKERWQHWLSIFGIYGVNMVVLIFGFKGGIEVIFGTGYALVAYCYLWLKTLLIGFLGCLGLAVLDYLVARHRQRLR
ncbi:hypothetical protein [Lactiplantibacillus fabifermentans]|nr:hypothetical protein [Lactiplantibacillus fabifermentans]